jgi:hypothetical protein
VLSKFEADIITISSTAVGTAYRFVNDKVRIKGFEGHVKRNLIVRRTLLTDDTEECLKGILDSIIIKTDEDFHKAIGIAQLMRGTEGISKLVFDRLKNRSVKDYLIVAKELKKHEKSRWYMEVPLFIEDALLKIDDIGNCATDVLDLFSALANEKIKIDGIRIAQKMFNPDSKSNIEIADRCLSVGLNQKKVLEASGISSILIKSISGGDDINGKSKLFIDVSNARHNLSRLKELTRIESLQKSSFDIDTVDQNTKDEIERCSTTFSQIISNLKASEAFLPNDMNELSMFEGKFKEINTTIKSLRTKVDINTLRNENNPRIIGIQLGIMLEGILNKMVQKNDLSAMISDAKTGGFISEDDFRTFNEIRDYRNKCAHGEEIPPLDKNKKEEWIRTISRMKTPIKEDGVK